MSTTSPSPRRRRTTALNKLASVVLAALVDCSLQEASDELVVVVQPPGSPAPVLAVEVDTEVGLNQLLAFQVRVSGDIASGAVFEVGGLRFVACRREIGDFDEMGPDRAAFDEGVARSAIELAESLS